MTSEKRAELFGCHPDDVQDVPQCAPRHVSARVDWNGDRSSIGMLHHVMAASDPRYDESGALKRLYHLRSRYDRNAARHKPGSYQKSGNVECQGQLVRWFDYVEQGFKCGAQVLDGIFLRRAIANRAHARPKLGRSAPNAILILLDDVGHVNDTGHSPIMARG